MADRKKLHKLWEKQDLVYADLENKLCYSFEKHGELIEK